MMEYYKFELINQLMAHYFNSCAITLDTADFVDKRYEKRIQKRLFKEFKRKLWTIGAEYRKFKRYWKKHKNGNLDANLNGLYAKYNLEFNEMLEQGQNSSLKRPLEDLQPLNINSANSCEGSGENASPAVEYHDCTNLIEDEMFEFDSPKHEDNQATANKKEQLAERSSEDCAIEPL